MKIKNLILTITIALFAIAVTHVKASEQYLDGKYLMELKIGDRVFIDHMDLQGQGQPLLLRVFNGAITGTVTVPGIFTSDLKGQGHCSESSASCELNFVIIAHEHGRDYKVFYHAELTKENYLRALSGKSPPVLTGTASLEDGQHLGPFKAIKQSKN